MSLESEVSMLLRSAPRRRRRNGGGVALLVFGIMFFFIGLLLMSMCLIANGILCDGTGIGSIGFTFFMIGLIPLILGIVVIAVTSRGAAALMADAPPIRDPSAALRIQAANLQFNPTPVPTPVASKCPECGAPVERGAAKCEFCDQPFV